MADRRQLPYDNGWTHFKIFTDFSRHYNHFNVYQVYDVFVQGFLRIIRAQASLQDTGHDQRLVQTLAYTKKVNYSFYAKLVTIVKTKGTKKCPRILKEIVPNPDTWLGRQVKSLP